ncbi:MAG: hypothetical protein CM15mP49_07800 [Actinomycetota bacterium]|nr:MAG: hypothetical protein CM15mP49_07800 [Actinomycetota bacterium]
MAFTVLGLLSEGVAIDEPNCVAKTCPEFFEYVDTLRLEGDEQLDILAIDGPAGSGKSSLAKLLAERLHLNISTLVPCTVASLPKHYLQTLIQRIYMQ